MDDGHYKQFQDVYGTVTTEDHRPSLQQKRCTNSKTLPFVASIQHVRNVNLMVLCEECDMWHLLYSPFKLSLTEKKRLETSLDQYTFTCGVSLSDLNLQDRLADVCVRDFECHNPVEKLYYEPICVYCCGTDNLSTADNCYPQCTE